VVGETTQLDILNEHWSVILIWYSLGLVGVALARWYSNGTRIAVGHEGKYAGGKWSESVRWSVTDSDCFDRDVCT